MDLEEAKIRLNSIKEICKRAIYSERPMLLSEYETLREIADIAEAKEEPDLFVMQKPTEEENLITNPKVIISCNVSIKQNPDKLAAVGVVIEFPDGNKKTLSQGSKSNTNNQAEYDAIYFGLTTLFNLHNNPGTDIEIRSDNHLVVKQLNGEIECHEEKLKTKIKMIQTLIQSLPVPVQFVWRPRNSTPELKLANNLAQDYLGSQRH